MKTVTIEVDPKFLPEGYEAVAYRVPVNEDQFIGRDGTVHTTKFLDPSVRAPWLVIRPVRQWHQVTEANILDVLKKWKDYDFRQAKDNTWRYFSIEGDVAPHQQMVSAIWEHGRMRVMYWEQGFPGMFEKVTRDMDKLQYSPKQ